MSVGKAAAVKTEIQLEVIMLTMSLLLQFGDAERKSWQQ
jgi:hypothetical protein